MWWEIIEICYGFCALGFMIENNGLLYEGAVMILSARDWHWDLG